MYPRICPQCEREYKDMDNIMSIVFTTKCLQCRADDLEKDRWQDEGGK